MVSKYLADNNYFSLFKTYLGFYWETKMKIVIFRAKQNCTRESMSSFGNNHEVESWTRFIRITGFKNKTPTGLSMRKGCNFHLKILTVHVPCMFVHKVIHLNLLLIKTIPAAISLQLPRSVFDVRQTVIIFQMFRKQTNKQKIVCVVTVCLNGNGIFLDLPAICTQSNLICIFMSVYLTSIRSSKFWFVSASDLRI